MDANQEAAEQSWVDRPRLERLINGEVTTAGFADVLLVGKMLRASSTASHVRRGVRARLGACLRASCAELELGCERRAMVAEDLLASLRSQVEEGSPVVADEVFSLCLLRDDIEAIGFGVAAARAAAADVDDAVLERLRDAASEIAAIACALDDEAEPWLEPLRSALGGKVDPPAELLDMLSVGPNPWWMDLVDPIWSRRSTADGAREPSVLARLNLREAPPAARTSLASLEAQVVESRQIALAASAVALLGRSNGFRATDALGVQWRLQAHADDEVHIVVRLLRRQSRPVLVIAPISAGELRIPALWTDSGAEVTVSLVVLSDLNNGGQLRLEEA